MYWADYLGIKDLQDGQGIRLLNAEYIMRNNILRQKNIYSDNQAQTKEAFAFKWSKQETYESEKFQDHAREWLLKKYLDNNEQLLPNLIPPGANLLDAGCGSGFSALLLFQKHINQAHYLGVDISAAVDVAKKRFEERDLHAEFLQSDLLNLPFSGPTFDIIFSEGVLHHTDSTQKALQYLTRLLLPGGKFLFYVYCKKAPIREFCDDHIRSCLKDSNDEAAWEQMLPLTKLGKSLGDLNVTVDVPEEIPYLGIPKGQIDLQRLFYWYIFKAYYKSDFTIEELNHINFDWYRPLNCHRHTPEEINLCCKNAGLSVQRMYVDQAGIAVIATKY